MNYTYKASIILINYNGKRYIDRLFTSLNEINTKTEDFEVIFYDNNSSDDSISYLKSILPKLRINVNIVEGKDNLGFAGGNNAAVKHAKGKYIVLLNNDTAVDKEWLNKLLLPLEQTSLIGITNSKLLFFYDFLRFEIRSVAGFKMLRKIKINQHEYNLDSKFSELILIDPKKDYVMCYDGGTMFLPLYDGITDYDITFEVLEETDNYDYFSLDFDLRPAKKGTMHYHITKEQVEELMETLVQNAGSKINAFYDGEDIGFGRPLEEKYNVPYQLDSACGASLALRHDDWEKLQGFDERFFMYYEDSDLSYRMKKLGKTIQYVPDSVVRHIHTGSSTEWSDFFIYHVFRNKLLFIYKNISPEKYQEIAKGMKRGAILERHKTLLRLRAIHDAKKIIEGKKNVHY